MVLGNLDSYVQKNESWSPTYTIDKNKFKVDKRFKQKSQHHKIPEENIGRKISDIPHNNIFTNMSPRARDIKEKINKWDLIKIKSFCMAKENSIKIQREPTVWENIFANHTSDKAWPPKYIKNSNDCTPGRHTTQLKNGQRTWTDTSPSKTYRRPRDIWKDAHHH